MMTAVFCFFPCFIVSATELIMAELLLEITYDFKYPSDISVSKDGKIFVLDGVNHQIKVFDHQGNFKFTFGKQGTRDGELNYPLGIDVGESGDVYIADSGNHRILIFNAEGRFKSSIPLPDSDKPCDPTDVAVNEATRIAYVADNDNHRILVIDLKKNQFIKSFGTSGEQNGQFNYPFLMSLDRKSNLCVVEVANTRVQVLDPNGLHIRFVGGWGVDKGQFYRPKGISVDKNGRIFVSDSFLGVIQIFNTDGDFFSVIGDPKTQQVKKFKNPVGISIDSKDRLYVVEMITNKVFVFQLKFPN